MSMSERANELIQSLNLATHPEGGYFREVFRSSRQVVAREDQRERQALTTIYYLLPAGDHSGWHLVASDEAWHYYEGASLEIFTVDPDRMDLQRVVVGPAGDEQKPVHVVPAGHWQASRSTGDYTLVGCTVGPGFDFADFRMLKDDPEMVRRFEQALPDAVDLI